MVETNAFDEPMVAVVHSSSAADIFMLLILCMRLCVASSLLLLIGLLDDVERFPSC